MFQSKLTPMPKLMMRRIRKSNRRLAGLAICQQSLADAPCQSGQPPVRPALACSKQTFGRPISTLPDWQARPEPDLYLAVGFDFCFEAPAERAMLFSSLSLSLYGSIKLSIRRQLLLLQATNGRPNQAGSARPTLLHYLSRSRNCPSAWPDSSPDGHTMWRLDIHPASQPAIHSNNNNNSPASN